MPTICNHFKDEFPIERRKQISQKILEKYVQKAPGRNIPDIDRKKYLVPRDLTVGQFIMTVRKRITLTPEKAIFMFVENMLPTTSELMGSVYDNHHDLSDNLLYFTYSGENTFGHSH